MKLKTAMLLAGLAAAGACAAEEIRVLSAAVMQTVFKEVEADFERQSGYKVTLVYATMGAITERVLGGETADLIIGSTPSLARLVKEEKVGASSTVEMARVGVGAVVPSGTPKPAFATPDDVRAALLGANVVVYANPLGGGAAGIHVAKVLERLGVAPQVADKTRFGAGGDVFEVTLAQGPGAFGFTQISEIVGKPGGEFVGPLPAPLQNYIGITAGIPVGNARPAAAMTLISFLKGPAAAAAMKRRGMEPATTGD